MELLPQGIGNMKHSRGFTLIELLITLAVLAIIMAIAVPSFNEQVRKSRRSEAIQGLSELQLRQERWRSNHTTYSDGTGTFGAMPASDNYDFAVTANTATDAAMTATPKGAQAGDSCGTYTLRIDNDDNSAPSGRVDKTVSTSATRCW